MEDAIKAQDEKKKSDGAEAAKLAAELLIMQGRKVSHTKVTKNGKVGVILEKKVKKIADFKKNVKVSEDIIWQAS